MYLALQNISRAVSVLTLGNKGILHCIVNGAKIDQVSEHRFLGITIDNKLRWDSHINNVCKTVSRRVFLLSKLRYIVDINTRKLFFDAYIKPHIDYASVVWDGCSEVLKKRLNSLHRRYVKVNPRYNSNY